MSLSAAPAQARGFWRPKSEADGVVALQAVGDRGETGTKERRRGRGRGRRISAKVTINRDEVKSSCHGRVVCTI